MAITLESSECFIRGLVQILLGHLEFLKQLQLLQSPQSRDFGSTDFIENDLEHVVKLGTHAASEKLKDLRKFISPSSPTLRAQKSRAIRGTTRLGSFFREETTGISPLEWKNYFRFSELFSSKSVRKNNFKPLKRSSTALKCSSR